MYKQHTVSKQKERKEIINVKITYPQTQSALRSNNLKLTFITCPGGMDIFQLQGYLSGYPAGLVNVLFTTEPHPGMKCTIYYHFTFVFSKAVVYVANNHKYENKHNDFQIIPHMSFGPLQYGNQMPLRVMLFILVIISDNLQSYSSFRKSLISIHTTCNMQTPVSQLMHMNLLVFDKLGNSSNFYADFLTDRTATSGSQWELFR